MDLSVVIPFYNEEPNVSGLLADVTEACGPIGRSYEIVCVNDGSSDGTAQRLDAVAAEDARVKVIHFARNYGQTPAMAAGLEASRGAVILMLDGDRQNDPADFSRLLEKLDEGYDLVSGWRKDRKDSGIRKLPSRIANRLIGRITGVRLHDYGCSLKAYRRGFLDPGELFGEMHRFLPVYVAMNGGRIAEMVVTHHPRTAGVSKYGLDRTFRVMADILLIHLLQKYATRPLHFFAKCARWLLSGAVVLFLLTGVSLFVPALRWAAGFGFLAGVVLLAAAAVIFAQGLVAEHTVRARYANGTARPWRISRSVNLDAPPTKETLNEPTGADTRRPQRDLAETGS